MYLEYFWTKKVGEYHDLYAELDFLLLADVFENFRITWIEYYNLGVFDYNSAPGFCLNTILKMVNVKLKTSDLVFFFFFFFFEKGIRGGILFIAHRYSCANNRYMNNYNENEKRNCLFYLGTNILWVKT